MEHFRKYFTPEQLNQIAVSTPNWGVDVHTIGHYIHSPHNHYPDRQHPHSHYFNWEQGRRLKEYQLVYIANGKGEFEAEGTPPSVLERGDLLLLYPDVWHRYRPLEDTGWEEYWVGFDGHYAQYLMRQDCFSPQLPLINIGFNAEFLSIFLRLIDTMKYDKAAYAPLSSCLVIQLLGLVYASALMTDAAQTRQQNIIANLRYKIHQSWDLALDLETLAREENVSYSWFRKAFKAQMGVSPGQYVLNIKIEKAAEMLQRTDFSIAEIAYKTGFETEFYFSRIFKKKLATTPTAFRRRSKA